MMEPTISLAFSTVKDVAKVSLKLSFGPDRKTNANAIRKQFVRGDLVALSPASHILSKRA